MKSMLVSFDPVVFRANNYCWGAVVVEFSVPLFFLFFLCFLCFLPLIVLLSVVPFCPDYDAVIELASMPSLRIGIEYERLRKTKNGYDEICNALANEKRVHAVLYITTSFNMLTFLHERLSIAGIPIAITMFSNLCQQLLNADVWETKSIEGRIPLIKFLTQRHSARAQKSM